MEEVEAMIRLEGEQKIHEFTKTSSGCDIVDFKKVKFQTLRSNLTSPLACHRQLNYNLSQRSSDS